MNDNKSLEIFSLDSYDDLTSEEQMEIIKNLLPIGLVTCYKKYRNL